MKNNTKNFEIIFKHKKTSKETSFEVKAETKEQAKEKFFAIAASCYEFVKFVGDVETPQETTENAQEKIIGKITSVISTNKTEWFVDLPVTADVKNDGLFFNSLKELKLHYGIEKLKKTKEKEYYGYKELTSYEYEFNKNQFPIK